MDGFDHILNWKLKAGSHRFPGQDGGTCINEAALVAAGFQYRPIRQAEDMPDCFSRPICRLAMWLNDEASDAERQRLLPFVTRLACADTPEVEREREAYMGLHMRRRMTFAEGLTVLEEVLAIGRQADPLALEDARDRMDDVKSKAGQRRAPKPASPANSYLVSKLKSWLGAARPEQGAKDDAAVGPAP
jgi:hypothetical protein